MNKTTLSDSEIEDTMLKTEDAIIAHSKISIVKSFIYFEMEGKPFRVRVYECGDKANQTLVCTFSYLYPQLHLMHLWTRLAEKYRIVVFEHGSLGLNTKLDDCYGL